MRTFAYAPAPIAILAAAIAIIIAGGPSPVLAHYDTPPPTPTGAQVFDGANSGMAVVVRDRRAAGDAPAFYRIGRVSAVNRYPVRHYPVRRYAGIDPAAQRS